MFNIWRNKIILTYIFIPSILSSGNNKTMPTNNNNMKLDEVEKRQSIITYKLKFLKEINIYGIDEEASSQNYPIITIILVGITQQL